mmetsp:Transcript_5833/g.17031  ORF Transcript_5833/g.17031 Transcript_5833/m.17031 type:complete len:200 (+) Transcript_5833:237-836(+)
MTSPENLMRNTVRSRVWPSSGARVSADTFAGKAADSRTPATIPATNAAQLKLPMSDGTETNRLVTGSASMIMYSSSSSLLFSRESAPLPNRYFHTFEDTYDRIPMSRISRFPSPLPCFSRQHCNSRTLCPMPRPASSRRRSMSTTLMDRSWAYCTISENRKAKADRDTSLRGFWTMARSRMFLDVPTPPYAAMCAPVPS